LVVLPLPISLRIMSMIFIGVFLSLQV